MCAGLVRVNAAAAARQRISLHQDKITRIEIVFDQMPLARAFGGKAPAHDTIGE
jgi:hypothetical protein